MSQSGQKLKHAPSPKLALNEVLQSLQDLVRNELAGPPLGESPKDLPAMATTAATQAMTPENIINELEAHLASLTTHPKPRRKPKRPTQAITRNTFSSHGVAEEIELQAVKTADTLASDLEQALAGDNLEVIELAPPPENNGLELSLVSDSPVVEPNIEIEAAPAPASSLSLVDDDAPQLTTDRTSTYPRTPAVELTENIGPPAEGQEEDLLALPANDDADLNSLSLAASDDDLTPSLALDADDMLSLPETEDTKRVTDEITLSDELGPPAESDEDNFLGPAAQASSVKPAKGAIDFTPATHTPPPQRRPSRASQADIVAPPAPTTVPPEGLQQSLPLPNDPLAEMQTPATAVPSLAAPKPTSGMAKAYTTRPTSDKISPAYRGLVPEEIDVNWDDIPILQDAVEQAQNLAIDKTTGKPQILSSEEARKMAIQVAARLNVELRKTGKRALASNVVARLAHLLQEALASGKSNVDNTPSKKK